MVRIEMQAMKNKQQGNARQSTSSVLNWKWAWLVGLSVLSVFLEVRQCADAGPLLPDSPSTVMASARVAADRSMNVVHIPLEETWDRVVGALESAVNDRVRLLQVAIVITLIALMLLWWRK